MVDVKDLKIEETYDVKCTRKGNFRAKLLKVNGEWCDVEVVGGQAKFISMSNSDRGGVGDKITLRLSFCRFFKIDEDGTTEGDIHVSIDKFGKDHWSMFAYIETRCVDYGGSVNKNHFRVDKDRHREFGHAGTTDTKYPTQLKGSVKLSDHDDWDCVDDLVRVGLLEKNESNVVCETPKFALTEDGYKMIDKLRRHKATGGSFSTFLVK